MTTIYGRSVLMATILIVATGVSHAADSAATVSTDTVAAPTPALDPAAVAALKAMSRYLYSLSHFAIAADISKDEVIEGNGKLQFDHQLKAVYARGKGLNIGVSSARQRLQYFYDHKQLSLYTPGKRVYTSIDAPATIVAMLALVEDKYAITLPLSDIFYWGSDKLPLDDIEAAFYVGPGQVRGQRCRHYAYRQADVDWQLCIADGDQPLPLKLVITTTDIDIQPEYIATMTWDLNPTISADRFTFIPPDGVAKIAIETVAPTTAANP